MNLSLPRKALRYANKVFQRYHTPLYVLQRKLIQRTAKRNEFNIQALTESISSFVRSMRIDSSGFRYRYSSSCTHSTLYSSAYACMALSLLGELEHCSNAQKREWVTYFDSFQNNLDGLFYDPVVVNNQYLETDWWGARHLALHMVWAYTDLGEKPRFPFNFLTKYYDLSATKRWLDSFDWINSAFSHSTDIDNKLMNICCLLQYQRDTFNDHLAAEAVHFIKEFLYKNINPVTGLWGAYDTRDPAQRSRMVQFAYHLLPIFFYDNFYEFDFERIVFQVLATQNSFGGFGVQINSSACEDIDSIDILVRSEKFCGDSTKQRIDAALNLALNWVLLNQADDGGFVFRLNEDMTYGHQEMSSKKNSGSLFPTWFRLLAIAQIVQRNKHFFKINHVPGLAIQHSDVK